MLTAILNAQKTTEYNMMKSGLTVITVSGRLFCLFFLLLCPSLSVTLFFFFFFFSSSSNNPFLHSVSWSRGAPRRPGGDGAQWRSSFRQRLNLSYLGEGSQRTPTRTFTRTTWAFRTSRCVEEKKKKTGENQTVTSAHTANISQIIKTMFSKQKRRAKVSKNEVSVSMSNPRETLK